MSSASEVGLQIEAEYAETLAHIADADLAIEARYIVTGLRDNRPSRQFQRQRSTWIK
jgi:hypothetical protein